MEPFGSFAPFCSSPASNSTTIDTSSPLPHCNLFFSSLLHVSEPPALTRLFSVPIHVVNGLVLNSGNTTDAVSESSNVDDPVVRRYVARAGPGVGLSCDVGRIGIEGSYGDVAQIIACAVCFFAMLYIAFRSIRRRAAVGRVEMVHLFIVSAITLVLKILTTGNILQQGSPAISVTSALHLGCLALTGWILLLNAFIAINASLDLHLIEQVLLPRARSILTLLSHRDGSPVSILLLYSGGSVFFALTTYFALDTAFGISGVFRLSGGAERDLRNVAVMVLGMMWLYLAVLVYFVMMAYVVYFHLHETHPLKWFASFFMLFAGAQIVQILASHPLCIASDARLTAGFLNTLMETAALGTLFVAWRSITEDDWYDDAYEIGRDGGKEGEAVAY